MRSPKSIFAMVVILSACSQTKTSHLAEGRNRDAPRASNVFDANFREAESLGEEREDFWTYYPSFGILRVADRLLLIAKDRESGRALTAELRTYSGRRAAAAIELAESPVPGSVATDVSDVVTPQILATHRLTADNRVNCWNYALFNAGVTRGIAVTNDVEFNHWTKSPLLRKVERQADLAAGDILVYRKRTPISDQTTNEYHAALYVSKNWMLSKNGAFESRSLRLVDAQLVHAIYLHKLPRSCSEIGSINNTACTTYVEAYHPTSIEAFAAQLPRDSQAALAVAEFKTVEEQNTIAVTYPHDHIYDAFTDQDLERWNEKTKQARNLVRRETERLHKKIAKLLATEVGQSLRQEDKDLLEGLRLRARSMNQECELGNCEP